MLKRILEALEDSPVIAAVKDRNVSGAVESPSMVVFDLGANIMTVEESVKASHSAGKYFFVHIDLAEGIGRDRSGIEYLKRIGVDGIISTRTSLLRVAKELSMITVKRIFLLDTQGVKGAESELPDGISDFIEIMPGIIPKMVERFSNGSIPVIAGGLIETKAEITSALSCGAVAVSTGKKELWYL